MTSLPWRVTPQGIEVRVRATPRGGRDALDGVETRDDGAAVLRVRVRAAPEDGAANAAIRDVLRRALGLPASAVALATGATARIKLFRIAGDGPALAARLDGLTGTSPKDDAPSKETPPMGALPKGALPKGALPKRRA